MLETDKQNGKLQKPWLFQKGQSGNPNGRPRKDVSLTSLLKEQIDTIPKGEKEGRTWRQILVQAWLMGSVKNPVLFKEMLERLEGRVAQPIAGENGKPIPVELVYKSVESARSGNVQE